MNSKKWKIRRTFVETRRGTIYNITELFTLFATCVISTVLSMFVSKFTVVRPIWRGRSRAAGGGQSRVTPPRAVLPCSPRPLFSTSRVPPPLAPLVACISILPRIWMVLLAWDRRSDGDLGRRSSLRMLSISALFVVVSWDSSTPCLSISMCSCPASPLRLLPLFVPVSPSLRRPRSSLVGFASILVSR